MTRDELRELQDWIKSLTGDAAAGAQDALQAVQMARMGGGGGGGMFPPPPEMEIDPDLEDPESIDDPEGVDPDLEIEDPDDVLKDKKSKKGDKESDEDPDDGDKKDGEGETDSDSDDKPDTKDGSDDDLVDDEIDLPDGVDGKESEKEKKDAEIFRRKVELSGAIKQLKRAKKKIDDGAVEATEAQKEKIKELAEEAEEKLRELTDDPDSVEKMSAAEFNDFINKALDAADELGVRHSKIDQKARIKKIKDAAVDEFAGDEVEAEDAANRLKDPEFQKMKAREREKERIRREAEEAEREPGGTFRGGIESFKADLKKAIGDQLGDSIEIEDPTYAIVNRHHEDDDIAVPGYRIDEIQDENKPSIDIYFDQSGSWGDEEVRKGMAAVADILKLDEQGLLDANIYYFSALLTQDQELARRNGRYECWDLVIENINAAPKTKNVIIMTDTDIGYDWGVKGCHGCIRGPGTAVDGCVWFLWKNGRRVPEASKKLRGKKGTFEYSV